MLDQALQLASAEALTEALVEALAVLVIVLETMTVFESVAVLTAGALQADQVLPPSLGKTVIVIHWVLVDVTVAIGSHALHVSGVVLVTTAGVLLLLLSHSLHVCGSAVVVLVTAAGVLLVDEAHSLHV